MSSPSTSSRTKSKLTDTGASKQDDAAVTADPPDVPKATRKRRAKRGSLADFVEIPVDLLFEIFGYLHPLDLIHLSRAAKLIRNILMSRSSRHIWVQARINLGIPEPPSDLNEPQYANLFFSLHCHFCLGPAKGQPIWSARLRCCKNCIPSQFMLQDPFLDDISKLSGIERQPSWEHILSMLPSIPCPKTFPGRTRKDARADVYLRTTAVECFNKYLPLTLSEKTAFMTNSGEDHFARRVHQLLCEDWLEQRSEERADELARIRSERETAIREKLTALGWGDELRNLSDSSRHKFLTSDVTQPKALTERTWNTIRRQMINVMENIKKERIHINRCKAFLEAFEEFRQSLPAGSWMYLPPLADIISMVPFASLMAQDLDTEITADQLRDAAQSLPEVVETWTEAKDRELFALLPPSVQALDDDLIEPSAEYVKQRLSLATTVFHCSCCDQPIAYPRILFHDHLTHPNWDAKECNPFQDDAVLMNYYFYRFLGHFPWNKSGVVISYSDSVSATLHNVVQACGLDPKTATLQDVETLDPIFDCRTENMGKSRFRFAALSSYLDGENGKKPKSPVWTQLTGEDGAQARAFFERIKSRVIICPTVQPQFFCNHCRCSIGGEYTILSHVKDTHSLNNPVEGTDFIRSIDTPKEEICLAMGDD